MKLKAYQKFGVFIVIYCLITLISFINPALAEASAVDIYFFHKVLVIDD